MAATAGVGVGLGGDQRSRQRLSRMVPPPQTGHGRAAPDPGDDHSVLRAFPPLRSWPSNGATWPHCSGRRRPPRRHGQPGGGASGDHYSPAQAMLPVVATGWSSAAQPRAALNPREPVAAPRASSTQRNDPTTQSDELAADLSMTSDQAPPAAYLQQAYRRQQPKPPRSLCATVTVVEAVWEDCCQGRQRHGGDGERSSHPDPPLPPSAAICAGIVHARTGSGSSRPALSRAFVSYDRVCGSIPHVWPWDRSRCTQPARATQA
jgi:hypothetical protein